MTSQPTDAGPAGTNLADVVRAAAAVAGGRPALISAGGTRTWAELDAAADAGAAALARYPAGERVVLGLPTSIPLAAALFAVLRAGLVAVPVDPRTDLAWVAGRVGAVAVVTDEAVSDTAGSDKVSDTAVSDKVSDTVSDAGVSGSAEVIGSAQVATWWDAPAAAQSSRAGGEDLAMLARAARSGPPVMLSHRAFLAAAQALRGAPLLDVGPDDRVVQLLPLFHVVGLVTAFLPAALAGAAVVIPDATATRVPVEAALDAVHAHRVSILPAEPTLYRQLDRVPDFARALATVRLMTSGSSPLDPADFAAIRTATGQTVREGYGISEAAAAITSTLMTPTAHAGSVGLPYPGVEIRILDGAGHDGAGHDGGGHDGGGHDGGGHDRGDGSGNTGDGGGDGGDGGDGAAVPVVDTATGPAGEIGEGSAGAGGETGDGGGAPGAEPDRPDRGEDLDGDMLADDFQDDGDVGPIAIRGGTLFSGYWPDGHDGPGPDGWYVTGDIGYTDDAGELHLVDRAAETVVVAGFTVYPREVEDVLVTHPYVADAAVVGVPGRGGETVVAVLVAQPGTRPTPGDLDEFVESRLAPFKRPTGYQVVQVLPRTEVGRLDRDSVRRGYAEHRGIALDAPPHLRAASGGAPDAAAPVRAAAADPKTPAAGGDPDAAAAPNTSPETVAGLDRLGTGLPSAEGRGRRSEQDTDEDLF